jgi:hypothetical protein
MSLRLRSGSADEQPVGEPLPDWRVPPLPAGLLLEGRYSRLEPLVAECHAASLYAAYAVDTAGRNWTYLPYGPFADIDTFQSWMETRCGDRDPLFYAVIERASGRALGMASYLRIAPESGSIELGHIHFSPLLQRTPDGHRSPVSIDQTRFRSGLPTLRVEMRCPQCAFAGGGAAPWPGV